MISYASMRGSRPAMSGCGDTSALTASMKTLSTTPTCSCGKRPAARRWIFSTSELISAAVTGEYRFTNAAPRTAASIPARIFSCGWEPKALRGSQDLRPSGAGYSGIRTAQLLLWRIPSVHAALLRNLRAMQLSDVGRICGCDTFRDIPQGAGRRTGRTQEPLLRTAQLHACGGCGIPLCGICLKVSK